MKKIIKAVPKCDKCGGELVIKEVMIDNIHCFYLIDCYCIVCDEEMYISLSLEDFIEINKRMLGGENGEEKK